MLYSEIVSWLLVYLFLQKDLSTLLVLLDLFFETVRYLVVALL